MPHPLSPTLPTSSAPGSAAVVPSVVPSVVSAVVSSVASVVSVPPVPSVASAVVVAADPDVALPLTALSSSSPLLHAATTSDAAASAPSSFRLRRRLTSIALLILFTFMRRTDLRSGRRRLVRDGGRAGRGPPRSLSTADDTRTGRRVMVHRIHLPI